MKQEFNLKDSTKQISAQLLDAMYLLDVLSELSDGEGKIDTIIKIIHQNIKGAFKQNEKFRRIILYGE